METSPIGEMDMLREMGVRPSFPEMARRYGMDRHAAAKHWKEGEGMEDGRSARRSGFDRYRDEMEDRAQMPGVTMKAMHEWLWALSIILTGLKVLAPSTAGAWPRSRMAMCSARACRWRGSWPGRAATRSATSSRRSSSETGPLPPPSSPRRVACR